jgi:hypothetical protein
MCSRVYHQPWQALGLPDQSPWVMQGRGMARALVLALRGLPELVARRTWARARLTNCTVADRHALAPKHQAVINKHRLVWMHTLLMLHHRTCAACRDIMMLLHAFMHSLIALTRDVGGRH